MRCGACTNGCFQQKGSVIILQNTQRRNSPWSEDGMRPPANLRKRLWHTGYFFQGFLEGDLFWGKFRLGVVIVLIMFFVLGGIITETLVLGYAEHLSLFEFPIWGTAA